VNFRRRRWGERAGGLPLTALIDVVFLLLVYFLVTSSLSPPESHLSSSLRADRRRGGAATDLQPQVIHVVPMDGSAVFRIGERTARTRAELAAVLGRLPTEPGVFVRVEPGAPDSTR
jgi:biopolymer transport protein ExbD